MRIIDLTQMMHEDMPVFPGIPGPKLERRYVYETDGFRATVVSTLSHTGTHMDAPAHLAEKGKTLDDIPVSHFVGKALVIDASDLKAGDRITMAHINKVREKADDASILLFRTDWDKNWGKEEYFGDYPCVDEEVMQYIIDGKKTCVGFDVIGIDPVSDGEFKKHKKLFNSADTVVLENLTNLGQCGDDVFIFAGLPLKYKDADGAPMRAVAILDVL